MKKKSINRAHDRMKKSAEEVLADTVKGYASVVPENTNVNISGGKSTVCTVSGMDSEYNMER